MAKATIHVSKFGTYHPDPKSEVAWTVNDTRGYIDEGPTCDECGACDCDVPHEIDVDEVPGGAAWAGEAAEEPACAGLSFAFVCLDGGEALCESCAETEVEVVECDCS